MTSANGTALVTGASSGMGAIYADRLARRGYDLILVARGQESLTKVADAIAAATGRAITPVRADLGNPEDLRRVESILRTSPSITMLVNHAGTGSVKPLLEADVDDMERMIEINVIALTRPVYAAAPAFAVRKHGIIINLASRPHLRRRSSTASTERRKPSCLPSLSHPKPNSPAMDCGSRRSYRVRSRRRPTAP